MLNAIHKVEAGDSLSKLAQRYYGDLQAWRKIWNANRELVPDPNRITPGQTLIIPDVVDPKATPPTAAAGVPTNKMTVGLLVVAALVLFFSRR